MPPERQQFVILEHQTPDGVHWDVMIQYGDVLWTWRMDCFPPNLTVPLPLEKIADHPLRFLTYEGPVQNRTGQVRRMDEGFYYPTRQTDNSLTVHFFGRHLSGIYQLDNIKNTHWLLTRHSPDCVI